MEWTKPDEILGVGTERADAVLVKNTNIPELLDEAGKLLRGRETRLAPQSGRPQLLAT